MKIASYVLSLTSLFSLTVSPILAAQYKSLCVPSGSVPFSNVGSLLGQVFVFVLVTASILLFLYLILGGVQWMTSGGDKVATQAAKDRLTAALVGILIILSVYGVMKIVEAAFGINVLGSIKLPTAPDSIPYLIKDPNCP
ncbi:MAG: hypothetical protein A3F33_02355 [Candidatus Woykebacteria bacterium RIFCSPHIGHO2_12_FULL_43_10]|uniref:Uncharacterized protein n=2 Tax=Candidatus Woykeibacteriota TaxID=1817899 RepID=A0A1G1WUT2_9BACT|nr:MAG: hypothetical protein A2802_00910 [Candidatus Woykebacteria bacterium RIFCSPHIGHO2_01_FULL_43_29]OGY28470.1 MAG: hypothetical protein A3J50_00405 [Candidatus Woykebacteria bacterium RIFCSPHIGHO2_02_FULL_43_16b]OGY28816.1 MAG: hypothetical protein A3F33_02355 [Candidatus Woykebacteria bacterium RIFCSPHIGHO2_12_FULL_43_10]OGY31090.1 MAG: hypothetical protein A3A61_03995 [Candidatus Woykebacteria bacterium RIFCSPLOWO2_01_FULL_43_14]